MKRRQEGRIYERCDSFYVQYWTTEIVNGQPKRVQRSQFLTNKDEQHYSKKAKGKPWYSQPLQLLRDEAMLKINQGQQPTRVKPEDMRISDYYERVYLPFVEENLRFSTVRGYKLIWNRELKAHFGNMTLREYRTHMGSLFLTDLAKSYGRRTLAHVRSLASAIFSHAINTGLLESNPWHDVRILGKVKAPEDTPHYTLGEVENIISALADHVDCQLVVALAFFLGLRPGEIEGLKWEDIDSESVHIRRAVVYGKIGETKTSESVASLPLIRPVLIPLELWHGKSRSPSQGWVFPNGKAKPISMNNLQNRIIRPVLEEKGIEWKGLYAGRRGAGTILTQLTGSAIAAQQILRHKNLSVTTGYYVKQIPTAGLEGMKLLEAAASNGNGKNAEEQQ
jgi:integrase